MSRRNRPSAFEVSFPDEQTRPGSTSLVERERSGSSSSSTLASSRPSLNAAQSPSLGSTTTLAPSRSVSTPSISSLLLKRKLEVLGLEERHSATPQVGKRVKPSQESKPRYHPQDRDIRETATTLIIGEDVDDTDWVGEENDRKPVRILTDFAIFDPSHELELISLDLINSVTAKNVQFEAAGYVMPVVANEEDEGQEEEEEEGIMQRLRTTAIFRFTLDYTATDAPIHIETEYAWYILRKPSRIYLPIYQNFFQLHRVTQRMISSALANPTWNYDSFKGATTNTYDPFLGKQIDSAMIDAAIPTLRRTLPSLQEAAVLRRAPMIRQILGGDIPNVPTLGAAAALEPPNGLFHFYEKLKGNIDLAVLRPENQQPTHVTALIDKLAQNLFHEPLRVVGPVPRRPDRHQINLQERQQQLKLRQYLKEHNNHERRVTFPGGQQLRGIYWKAVRVGAETYEIGDCVVVRGGEYSNRPEPTLPHLAEIPKTATAQDYFWFGRIIYLDQMGKKAHVRWFEHATKSMLQEISHPLELFLANSCGDIDAKMILGKANVMFGRPPPGTTILQNHDYFCSFQYSDADGSFTSVPPPLEELPPENCHTCNLSHQLGEEAYPQQTADGFSYRGIEYHLYDYVLLTNPRSSLCDIAQIDDIMWPTPGVDRRERQDRGSGHREEGGFVKLKKLGRVSDIVDVDGCPPDIIKDERHLFFTKTEFSAPITKISGRCYVVHTDSFSRDELGKYLSVSPYHFYVKFSFPDVLVTHWRFKGELRLNEVSLCGECGREVQQKRTNMEAFLKHCERKPLRAFDPFGGIGGFTLGMEEVGCMKTTHAIEISPSAAETLKKNSPGTIVYNQCSNVILRYAIKKHEGHDVEAPNHIAPKTPVPEPPKPGTIDCIVAGFPCQPHSRLNMFQRADDKKSHLILNLMSWVDFLKPKYCYFENVRGFLKFNLNAVQAGRYRVEGGIEMGGLKWVVNSLLEMNYQVRYGLLQAAHFGTPQTRVRFFLIAAQPSCPLPALPTPLYEFPDNDALEIRSPSLPNPIAPRNSKTKGLYRFVTIEDAIGDLPRFDWRHPNNPYQLPRRVPNPGGGEFRVPVLPCESEKGLCGYAGAEIGYFHQPKTTFQVKCRAKPTEDLQHYTKVLKDKVIERVISIPLEAKADYRTLQPSMWEWQFSNPASAVARDGFRPGLYGRLDQHSYFQTTVTNVEPTAKQSWVLNPYCKRMVTVRELARSQGFPDHFVFIARNNDIKTMHRQIGNAVAWPVAAALGYELRETMLKKWLEDQENVIEID